MNIKSQLRFKHFSINPTYHRLIHMYNDVMLLILLFCVVHQSAAFYNSKFIIYPVQQNVRQPYYFLYPLAKYRLGKTIILHLIQIQQSVSKKIVYLQIGPLRRKEFFDEPSSSFAYSLDF